MNELLRTVPRKFNFGSGACYMNGYVNVDIKPMLADMKPPNYFLCDNITTLKNLYKFFQRDYEVADEISSYHALEHLGRPRNNCQSQYNTCTEDILIKWIKFLKVGGTLVIEVPDFDKLVYKYYDACAYNDTKATWNLKKHFYGLDRNIGDVHTWGFSRWELIEMFGKLNLKVTNVSDGTDYHAKDEPCFRIEAVKL